MFSTLDEMGIPGELQTFILKDDDSCNGVEIPIKILCRHINPVSRLPWRIHSGDNFFVEDVFKLSHDEIAHCVFTHVIQCVDKEIYDARPFQSLTTCDTYEYHCQRIAYLVKHKSDEPIFLDLCDNPEMILTDGNHRLYAAIARGDEYINIEFTGYAVL